jgi:hypothetical protein
VPRPENQIEQGKEAYDNEISMFRDAQKTIRRLGSKLNALNASLYRPLLYVLHAMGYDPKDAAKKLLGLSTQYEEDDRAVTRYQVETALRLPHSEAFMAEIIIKNRKRDRERAAQKRKTNADQS